MKTLTEQYLRKQNKLRAELEKLRQKILKMFEKWIDKKWIMIHDIETATPYTNLDNALSVPQCEPLRKENSDLDKKFLANYQPRGYLCC